MGTPLVDTLLNGLGGTRTTANRINSHLRKAGLLPLSKPGKGAVPPTTRCAATMLTAFGLAPSNSQAVETVRRVLSLEMVLVAREGLTLDQSLTLEKARSMFDYLRDIGIHPLQNFGDALTALLDSMRPGGAFTEWAADGGKHTTLEFQDDGRSVSFYALPTQERSGVFVHFGEAAQRQERGPSVSRKLQIDERLLMEIAATLGPLPCPVPLPEAIPPPINERPAKLN
jgi:hypothetical protein